MKNRSRFLMLFINMMFLFFLVSCVEPVTYNITFQVDDTIYHQVIVEENEPLVLPITPTKEEHQFIGWVDNEGNNIEEGTIVVSDMTINAEFKINEYIITFNYNDGETEDLVEKYAFGAKIKEPEAPKRRGYTFKGWYIGDERYKFSTMPNENITLSAKWTLDETVIAFDSNGGTSIPHIIALPGDKITAPEDPYLKGCEFLGWYLNDELYEFDVMPSESITLVAKWKATIYTITYELNGGTFDNPITTYSSDRKLIMDLGKPVKEGYSFMGWYRRSNFSGSPMFELSVTQTGNLTLYAKWSEAKLKEPKTVSIYGDSISTYEGYVPWDALFYYPIYSQTVKSVEKTWWRLLQNQTGLELFNNISYSGSTVTGTSTSSGSSMARIRKLLNSDGEYADILIILLGINDVVSGVTKEKFETEYREMLDLIKEQCPNMDIIMCNLMYETYTEGKNPTVEKIYPGLRDELNTVIAKIASDYNYPLVELDKVITEETEFYANWYYLGDNIHPGELGMIVMAEAITKKILELY